MSHFRHNVCNRIFSLLKKIKRAKIRSMVSASWPIRYAYPDNLVGKPGNDIYAFFYVFLDVSDSILKSNRKTFQRMWKTNVMYINVWLEMCIQRDRETDRQRLRYRETDRKRHTDRERQRGVSMVIFAAMLSLIYARREREVSACRAVLSFINICNMFAVHYIDKQNLGTLECVLFTQQILDPLIKD